MRINKFITTICLLAFCWMPRANALQAENATNTPGLVYVIPIRGMIEPALLYVIRRGVAEAENAQARAVIFVMNTPGGTLNAASEIVRTIQKVTIPTYTFVEKDAYSAGAIIALATKHIYMAPGSVIGDAMPIMMNPLGGVQEMPEDLQEKAVSAVAGLVRSAAQESGHDPKLAEKMVRRDMEYRIGDEVISPTNQLLTLTNVEAERRYGPDNKPLLSEGTVKDVPALLKAIGQENAEIKELKVTLAERVARFIAMLAPLFLIGGLLGIYIEVKTPGFGLPGILGITCLMIFFWGHHIAGLAGMEDLILFGIGVTLLLVELFVLPGFGLVGFAGILCMLVAMLSAMIQRYPGMPWYQISWPQLQVPILKLSISLIGSGIAAFILARYLPETTLFKRLVLSTATSRSQGFEAAHSEETLIGQEGITISALRPSGAAMIGDRRVDVVTRGEFVERDAPIRIAEVHGQRIIVEPINKQEG
jgi:membrane-bound serine protease (ClpP class)